MNTELLLKVKAAILAEPLKFDMDYWFKERSSSPCGTTACIAGHAMAIGKKWKSLKPGLECGYSSHTGDIGQELLKLDDDQRVKLFGLSGWPTRFRYDYEIATTALNRAKATARRIDHFIATEGRE